jgi:RNA polymerase sigma factor for flagellar operon FliA
VAVAAPSRFDADAHAVEGLVTTHLALVGHLVREVVYRVPAHVSRDDLVSAGMLSLVLSARTFDASLGVPFGRFAAIRIRGALIDELRAMDWASRAVRGKARDLEATRNRLTATHGRTVRRREIAQAMRLSAQELDRVEQDVRRAAVLSLQGLAPDERDELLPAAAAGPEELLLWRERIGYLHDAIAELPDRLRTVVEQYFFAQRRMADIATELGVTESRVSQLRSEALSLLRAGLHSQDGAPLAARADRRRSDPRPSYCAAIAARSTVKGRLGATTPLGDVRPRRRPRAEPAPVGGP